MLTLYEQVGGAFVSASVFENSVVDVGSSDVRVSLMRILLAWRSFCASSPSVPNGASWQRGREEIQGGNKYKRRPAVHKQRTSESETATSNFSFSPGSRWRRRKQQRRCRWSESARSIWWNGWRKGVLGSYRSPGTRRLVRRRIFGRLSSQQAQVAQARQAIHWRSLLSNLACCLLRMHESDCWRHLGRARTARVARYCSKTARLLCRFVGARKDPASRSCQHGPRRILGALP